MANLFVTDNNNNTHTNLDDDLDLMTCLEHPRVSKVTIMPDGTLVAEMIVAEKADDIIRKKEGLHKANKTGFRGVSIRGNKFRADISEDGVQYNLGSFDTIQEAVEARIKAELGLD